jgi:hypothetical protein
MLRCLKSLKGKRMKPVLLREIVERQIYHPQGNRVETVEKEGI